MGCMGLKCPRGHVTLGGSKSPGRREVSLTDRPSGTPDAESPPRQSACHPPLWTSPDTQQEHIGVSGGLGRSGAPTSWRRCGTGRKWRW